MKTGRRRLDALLFSVFLKETLTILETGLCHCERGEGESCCDDESMQMRMPPPLRQKEAAGNTVNQ